MHSFSEMLNHPRPVTLDPGYEGSTTLTLTARVQ